MFSYGVRDVLVDINEQTLEFLRQMAPSIPAYCLSYVSPLQPSLYRKGKSFKETQNNAVNVLVCWKCSTKPIKYHILHMAGRVQVSSLCSCPVSSNRCHALKPNMKCHGTLSDELGRNFWWYLWKVWGWAMLLNEGEWWCFLLHQ